MSGALRTLVPRVPYAPRAIRALMPHLPRALHVLVFHVSFFPILYFTSIIIVYNSYTVQNSILIKIDATMQHWAEMD